MKAGGLAEQVLGELGLAGDRRDVVHGGEGLGPFGLIRYVRLDVTTAAEIVDLLRLTRQSGLAIALVSHDEALLAAVADRIVRIRDGTTTART